jgi:quercetin dioxygenase-like cupin family protein/DNA-binding XRE family transcriptional regulator
MAQEEIGARLRDARMQRGLSLRSVAQELGVSASLISQVETGKTQPSVSTLYALVNHLGVSMDELLGVGPVTPPAAAPATGPSVSVASPQPAVQHGADNPVLEMENGVRWERLATGQGGPVDPLLVTYDPGASSSIEGKMMRHAGLEYAYILEGELTLQLEFDTHVLRAGDSLQFDSLRPHLYVNHGDTVARGIWFVVGRRQHNEGVPTAPGGGRNGTLGSAVDVLRAMDDL